MKVKEIINIIEDFAPLSYQESYDNAGLIVGDAAKNVSNILITLDVTEHVIDEAISKNCELIVAHHPIIFAGLKKLTGSNYVERTVIKAIKNDIAIYASHTNLDNIKNGVNTKIAEKLGLINTEILSPKKGFLGKLSVFVPKENADEVKSALHQAGAGQIGEYKDCAFETAGKGSFLPSDQANPRIGNKGKLEKVDEHKIEVIFPMHLKNRVLSAMKKAHPYEEVAYYLHQLENTYDDLGSGMIGEIDHEMEPKDFFDYLKEKMDLSVIKHTTDINRKIKRVAICGGAGSFLISQAKNRQADIYISSDIKYHEFFDADKRLIIADIGHYESERFTNEIFYAILKENFANIALHLGQTVTNPIKYY
jgi:dinuclear metal center YbgI/SA1388 family protein